MDLVAAHAERGLNDLLCARKFPPDGGTGAVLALTKETHSYDTNQT
jgi:hypothetical protein